MRFDVLLALLVDGSIEEKGEDDRCRTVNGHADRCQWIT